jgi:hypothetical protein
LPERLANALDVSGGIHRREIVHQVARQLDATPEERRVGARDRVELLARGRALSGRDHGRDELRRAAEGIAALDAARVEGDHVEVPPQLVDLQGGAVIDEHDLDAGSRSAGDDEERTPLLRRVGIGQSAEPEGERRAVGAGVVHRHRNAGALGAGGVVARRPLEWRRCAGLCHGGLGRAGEGAQGDENEGDGDECSAGHSVAPLLICL